MVWHGLEPPYEDAVRLGRGARAAAGVAQPGAVPPADAVASARGGGFRKARRRRLLGRMEMGRHPPAGRRAGATPTGGSCARIYSRTGEDVSRGLPRSRRGARLRGRARRRTADRARGPRAELQRAAAAPQPEDRDAEAAGRVPGPSARLRYPRPRARRICARCPSPSAARGSRRFVARSAIRASTSRRSSRSRPGTSSPPRAPTRPRAGAGRRRRGDRGLHDQARRQPLPAGPPEGATGGSGSATRTSSTP